MSPLEMPVSTTDAMSDLLDIVTMHDGEFHEDILAWITASHDGLSARVSLDYGNGSVNNYIVTVTRMS